MCSTNIHFEIPNKTTIDLSSVYLAAKQKFESWSSKPLNHKFLWNIYKYCSIYHFGK